MVRRSSALGGAMLAAALLAGCASARPQATPTPRRGDGGAGAEARRTGPKPYKEVVTARAVTDSGLIHVHQLGSDTLYFEIPVARLGQEMLVVSRIARTATGIGYGGEQVNQEVVRWERQGSRVLLRTVTYVNVAEDSLPISLAVRASNFEPVVAALPILAFGADSASLVVDAGALFLKDVALFSIGAGRREAFQVRRLDEARTFLSAVRSFPRNVETRVVLTYEAGRAPSNQSTGSISIEMNHSMILLPERPMTQRLWDERVGFFRIEQTDYGRDVQRAETRRYIRRWRLEPRDTAAFLRGELVEPVKPIVYYIDPATPLKWRKYLKQGVEDWNRAFEEAGFRNAIVAKDPPTPEEDPEFSPEDARYSVIRYFSSDIQNAYGPNVADPRTGEILESDIGWYHNVMNLLRNWYLIQTAAVNPAARKLDFDDEVMGELIRFVSAHEVGHTIGLPHNMKASSAYPVDSLRSGAFTRRMGTAPSIMDYARFNYVAQPGDSGVSLHPAIGPYDLWAIRWGYRPVIGAATPDEEKRTLDAWVREREGNDLYRFGDPSTIDPTSQTEDLGDDGVKASDYGIENLKRILPELRSWSHRPGADYAQLRELYDQVLVQWTRYMGHVATIIGGVTYTRKAMDQAGPVYEIVPKARQQAAMDFLVRQAFRTPAWMIDRETLARIDHATGAVERLRQRQIGALAMVLEPRRLQRLIESEAAAGREAYGLGEALGDVRRGVWTELAAGRAADAYRRNLQRGYVERMRFLMTEELPPIPPQLRQFATFTDVMVGQSDIRPFVRAELETLRGEIRAALPRTADRATRVHYNDVLARIQDILEPRR
ncbi:MAG TPA: zinc-dependent metalloprotease [Gemmatimonadales bacterium]|nr:zinc-dependent metalloprotease [Gemmatimonadales bacterium]